MSRCHEILRPVAILLTFAKPQGGGAGTALASARLTGDGTALSDLRILFEAADGGGTGRHFGSRVVEGRDGTLFVTIGDRGNADLVQNLGTYNGKIVRINRDGSIPPDNPFVGVAHARPEIWSLGHRNSQGAGLDAQGRLWISEHGARGGDEINLIDGGRNYGWPVISYGRHYSGGTIGEGTAKPGLEQPEHYWDPSIAPSGLMVYSGRLWPDWRGIFSSARSSSITSADLRGRRCAKPSRYRDPRPSGCAISSKRPTERSGSFRSGRGRSIASRPLRDLRARLADSRPCHTDSRAAWLPRSR